MITVEIDPKLLALPNTLTRAAAAIPGMIQAELADLGELVESEMRDQMAPNRWRGHLEESVEARVEPLAVEIAPRLRAGPWYRGDILEYGTQPIPDVPFDPIADWAEGHAIPAVPVWLKIRRRGVSPHPYILATRRASERHIVKAGDRLVLRITNSVFV